MYCLISLNVIYSINQISEYKFSVLISIIYVGSSAIINGVARLFTVMCLKNLDDRS